MWGPGLAQWRLEVQAGGHGAVGVTEPEPRRGRRPVCWPWPAAQPITAAGPEASAPPSRSVHGWSRWTRKRRAQLELEVPRA